ncbi:MAG: universal stress protein [Saprospiraceae bacterium]|nr:universal stress protein [Saprospiraceae bacterium]
MDALAPKKSEPENQENAPNIKQAVVAMALGDADETTLNYLAFFTEAVPLQSGFFLHVQPQFDLLNALFESEAQSVLSNFDLNADMVRQIDQSVRRRFGNRGLVQLQADVREGDPLEEILRAAADLNADLLVAGKNSTGETHGILASNLVRKAPGNVLIVPDRARPRITRILVPVDFSPYSVRALQTAAALMSVLPETVEVIATHVYQLPSVMAYRINKTQDDLQAIIEADRKAAMEDFVRNFAPELSDRIRFEVWRHENTGIAEHLLDFSTANEVDLIIMGAKGHSKVELLLMGSVTERLLQLNEMIPVWVVK